MLHDSKLFEEMTADCEEKRNLCLARKQQLEEELESSNKVFEDSGKFINLLKGGRKVIDYTDPYKAFPFINPNFQKSGYLVVNDYYHDTLFPYSELKNTLHAGVAMKVTNGLTKIYVGNQYTPPHYRIGEPILIYRKHNGVGQKRFKSCLTSFCIVTDVIQVKQNHLCLISFDKLISRIGNKSVFDINELKSKYDRDKNITIAEMLYYGYFGEGHNVNMDWLENNGLWSSSTYPTLLQLSPEQFKKILMEGNIDVNNVVVN